MATGWHRRQRLLNFTICCCPLTEDSKPVPGAEPDETAILNLSCQDRAGLVSEVSSWIARHGGNILHADHHIDGRNSLFLTRVEWSLRDFNIPRDAIHSAVSTLLRQFNATGGVYFSNHRTRVAIFVGRQDHCLQDLLWRVGSGELSMDVPLVVSNHPRLRPLAEQHGCCFAHVPISPDTKREAEAQQLQLLTEHGIELIVLAKYMQVLSSRFLDRCPVAINIHHSFLPAFTGSMPYHKAWKRGVKLIGATAHYVSEDLDAGPIIEQALLRVSHRDGVEDLMRMGRDLERQVLARALHLHLRHQVVVYAGRTAVFA